MAKGRAERFRAYRIRERVRAGKKVRHEDTDWLKRYQDTALGRTALRGDGQVAVPAPAPEPEPVAPIEVQSTSNGKAGEVPTAPAAPVPEQSALPGALAGEGATKESVGPDGGMASGALAAGVIGAAYAAALESGDREAIELGAPLVFGPDVRAELVRAFVALVAPRLSGVLGEHADEKSVIAAPIIQRAQNWTIKAIRARRAAQARGPAVPLEAEASSEHPPEQRQEQQEQPPPAPRGMTIKEMRARLRAEVAA